MKDLKDFNYSTPLGVSVPTLDIDKRAFQTYGKRLTPWGRRERRIVANLIAHLALNGYTVIGVFNGENEVPTPSSGSRNMKDVMEAAFAGDAAQLYVRHREASRDITLDGAVTHTIELVFGLPDDHLGVISDWDIHRGDVARFKPVIESFDAEVFA